MLRLCATLAWYCSIFERPPFISVLLLDRNVIKRFCTVLKPFIPTGAFVKCLPNSSREVASHPGSSPYRKTGREPGRTDHVPSDVLCVVLCVVLIIELLPTQSAPLSMAVLSGTRAVIGVLDQWMSLRL